MAADSLAEELRRQIEELKAETTSLQAELDKVNQAKTEAQVKLEETVTNLQEQRKLLDDARKTLTDTFKALSSEALQSSNKAFLELARETLKGVVAEASGDMSKRQQAIETLVKPLQDALRKYEQQINAIEANRQKQYGGLEELMKAIAGGQQALTKETGSLVNALRTPHVRGQWGEMTLRNAVELAGMSRHCDFTEQVSVDTEDGRLRPDMIVRLPGDRQLIVDAKAVLDGYMEAIGAETEDARNEALVRHARHVRERVRDLASKKYREQFPKALDMVLLFIPGESFLIAALESEPDLISEAAQKRVLITSPTSLIAVLVTVAHGWRQEQVAEHARRVGDMGRELYGRIATFAHHMDSLGSALGKATKQYDEAVGSLERMVLPSVRQFKELGTTSKGDIKPVLPIDTEPRKIDLARFDPEADESELSSPEKK